MNFTQVAHSKIVDLLKTLVVFNPSPSSPSPSSPSPSSPSPSPSPVSIMVYPNHKIANLIIPALSVEVETTAPIPNNKAINQQELIDNWMIRISIKVHTGYRLGVFRVAESYQIADSVIRLLRENVDLQNGYRIFDVGGIAYNGDHTVSGTTGADIIVDVHKVENYQN